MVKFMNRSANFDEKFVYWNNLCPRIGLIKKGEGNLRTRARKIETEKEADE